MVAPKYGEEILPLRKGDEKNLPQNASIIIGAGLGDEGKGHYTDILCNKPCTLDIRFNGGSQAAHTVVTPQGEKHIFRHLGAGTFTGCPTYLPKTFIVNPATLVMEYKYFANKYDMYPTIYVNPEAYVSTLWDMYLNQAIEVYRSKNSHGSCGLGIFETTQRSRFPKYDLRVSDLEDKAKLVRKLHLIKDEYIPLRLKEEYKISIDDFSGLTESYKKDLLDDNQISMFLFFVDEFLSIVKIRDDSILACFDNLVFEGAQGLGLDKDYPGCSYDYLTASSTGIKNALYPIVNSGFTGDIDVYYISRPYVTRHGKGPLEHEVDEIPYTNICDGTNRENQFQGKLRYGYLDFDTLAKNIKHDMKNYFITPTSINLGFTCVDQLGDQIIVGMNGELQSLNNASDNMFIEYAKEYFSTVLPQITGFSYTYGLTRNEFCEL